MNKKAKSRIAWSIITVVTALTYYWILYILSVSDGPSPLYNNILQKVLYFMSITSGFGFIQPIFMLLLLLLPFLVVALAYTIYSFTRTEEEIRNSMKQ